MMDKLWINGLESMFYLRLGPKKTQLEEKGKKKRGICKNCKKPAHLDKKYYGCSICDHLNTDCCGSKGMYYPNECSCNTAVIEQEERYAEEEMAREIEEEEKMAEYLADYESEMEFDTGWDDPHDDYGDEL